MSAPPAESALNLLQRVFGFNTFHPGQAEVVDTLLSGRSALAVFPTGGGKSICYQLPALMLDGLTVVVSPLIALMKDQIDFLLSKGVSAARLDSSVSAEEARATLSAISSGELRLLYVAPERFNNEGFRSQLRRTKIALFAVDEAHCISEWGHNFRPDYLKLAEAAKEADAERILALTATATPSVVKDVCTAFGIEEADAQITGFYRPNLTLLTTPSEDRDRLLLQRLRERRPGSTIAYVTFQKSAERVAEMLAREGLPAQAYHAGMDGGIRSQIQDWWKEGDDRIVVATIAFGMGIDKASVRYVYHVNLPKSLESYSQEIGRAGRDGEPATVEMFASREDVPILQNFVYGDTPSHEAILSVLQELDAKASPMLLDVLDLANRHDLRPLVLKTLLTYLELLGALSQGTAIYAGYEFRPLVPINEIADAFPGEPGAFVDKIFALAKRARIWFSLVPEEIAAELRVERRRVVRALEVLAERGLVELRGSEVRTPYTKLTDDPLQAHAASLAERFQRRENAEIARIDSVIELVEAPECQVNRLASYFGQVRDEPCGHCTFCLTGEARLLPEAGSTQVVKLPGDLEGLRAALPPGHQGQRELARALCGLASPSFTRAKTSRHPLFGALAAVPFASVLASVGE